VASSSKVNGSWKDNSGWYVKVDGVWKAVSYGYTKTNGEWKSFLVPTPTPTPVFTPTPTPVFTPTPTPTPVFTTPTPTPTPVYTAPNDCIDDDAGYCANVGADGYGDGYNYQYSPSGLYTCPPRYYGRTFCGVPTPTPTPTPTPVYSSGCTSYSGPCGGSCCPFGTYTSPCGTYGNGTITTCVTPVGCANVPITGCVGDYAPTPTPTPYTAPTPTPYYSAPIPTPTPYSVYPIPTPTPYTAPTPTPTPTPTPYYSAPIPTPTPYTAPRFVDPYYGVGNPCIQGDTMVLVSVDGLVTTKKAREVEIGDLVVSLNFSEIDKNDPDWNLYEWMSESLTFVDPQVSKVINKTQSVHPKVAYFNGRVEATFSEFHPFLVRRGGVYEFYTVSTLLPGDTIFTYNNNTNTVDPLVIETVAWIEGATDAYNFSVEAYDIVIAGGYVTHNK
jgi:hypothetical protein